MNDSSDRPHPTGTFQDLELGTTNNKKSDDGDDDRSTSHHYRREISIEDCGHLFCTSCVYESIKVQVEEQGSNLPVCPMAGCEVHLQSEWIINKILFDHDGEDRSQILHNLLRIERGSELTECLPCDGNALPGQSRAKRAKAQDAARIKKTEKALKEFTKQCPSCGVHAQKSGGCDEVKCGACKEKICWCCGEGLDNSHAHSCKLYKLSLPCLPS